MDYLKKIIGEFEIHSENGIRECFENGLDPNQVYDGKPLLYELINMYLRGPQFKNCVKAFVDFGLKFEDPVLLAIWLDDGISLEKLLTQNKEIIHRKYSLDSTFTPVYEASPLHICSEYGHLSCAKTLIKFGADINSKAGFDPDGFGGQTPIFHTVNQHRNTCMEVMKLLIENKADLDITIKGLIWGRNYEWETFIPSVNPISYSMMGLLPQFQRTEKDIYEVVSILLKARFGIHYFPNNVPNKYLSS